MTKYNYFDVVVGYLKNKIMRSKIISIITFSILIITSCSSDDNSNEMSSSDELTIYVAGSNGREDNGLVPLQALLWINGELTELTSGQTDAEAFSVYVDGSDVYVAGYEYENSTPIAKYWKNGVSVALTDGTRDASANAIVVNDGDVYVAGYERSEIPGGRLVATYWKNGISTALTDGSKGAGANALAIVNNEVHVVGSESTGPGGVVVAKYWINGNAISLTDDTDDAFGTAISIDQGEVYIALRQNSEINGDDIQIASYWNDNQVTTLETNTAFCGAFGILAENGNLYVCGTSQSVNDSPTIRYWLNGELLSSGTVGDAYAIAKLGDAVYYAGNFNVGSNSQAAYWKGNEMTTLPSEGFNFVQATAIFLK